MLGRNFPSTFVAHNIYRSCWQLCAFLCIAQWDGEGWHVGAANHKQAPTSTIYDCLLSCTQSMHVVGRQEGFGLHLVFTALRFMRLYYNSKSYQGNK